MSAEVTTDPDRSRSRWRRLRNTPLRDVLRGRLSGRLDVEAVIRAAGLPGSLADLVRTTARRTRLWRIEKVEVVRELVGHFQDGIDAGATVEELTRSFGDPGRSARLIRRAKIRNRGAAWRAGAHTARSILLCVALLIVAYLGLTIRLYSGSAKLSRNYLAELNAAALAVPEKDRAWPLYRRAFLQTTEAPRTERLDPKSKNWTELVAFAEKHAELIPLYHAAARKPHLGYVHGVVPDRDLARRRVYATGIEDTAATEPDENPVFMTVLLPELEHFRNAARLLIVDAQVAAGIGNADRAFEDVVAVLGFVKHVLETPVLISNLVGIGILNRNTEAIRTILWDHPDLFSEKQLAELSHRLAGIGGGGRLRVSFTSERWTFEDVVQRLYTDDGKGNGHLTPTAMELLDTLVVGGDYVEEQDARIPSVGHALLSPAIDAVLADRRDLMRQYNELMTAFEAEAVLPLWERRDSAPARAARQLVAESCRQLRYLPMSVLVPSLSRVSAHAELGTLCRDAALAILACKLYYHRTGAWPESLDELVPTYLPALPVDRFDGRALRYHLAGGRPLLYSVGSDLDDDAGRTPESREVRRQLRDWRPEQWAAPGQGVHSPNSIDGDWVLWPPVE